MSNNQGIKISGGTINADQLAVGTNAQIYTSHHTEAKGTHSTEPLQPIKVLFLAANPLDTTPLSTAQEVRSIDQALRNAQFRDYFDLQQQTAVRIGDLQSHLLRYQPDIVHFSGHGSATSELLLEDAHGYAKPVAQQTLVTLFALLKDNIRCVVLNACFSHSQATAIAHHIDWVLGMSNAIGDEAAIAFSMAFYQALGYGRSVKTAFELGKVQIDLEGLNEQDIPVLLAMSDTELVFVNS